MTPDALTAWMASGAATLPYWLPVALADIYALMLGIGGIDATRADVLDGWGCRPVALAERQAAAAENERQRRRGLDALAERLKEWQRPKQN